MNSDNAREPSGPSPISSLPLSDSPMYAARANRVANLLLEGLKDGVRREQEQQRRLEFAVHSYLQPGLTQSTAASAAAPVALNASTSGYKLIVGLFDDLQQAEFAVRELTSAGLPLENISLVADNAREEYTAGRENEGRDYRMSAGIKQAGLSSSLNGSSLVHALIGKGVSEEHADCFTESIRQGAALVVASCETSWVDLAIAVMNRNRAVDIDERLEQLRREGSVSVGTADTDNTTALSATKTRQTPNPAGAQTLNVVEEELVVGKRQVQSGGVRVYTHVTEQPVEANVNLREEHVTVERHAVNRPVDASAFNTIKDGVIEVTETAEVPVVAKEARIVEEVVVGKEATERTEMIHDIMRRTDVEVEQIAGQTVTSGTLGNYVNEKMGRSV